MKLAGHANQLETNAKVKSQDFGISDIGVIIDMLRNRMYEHKIRTLTQEYMSNGRDAQREIGSKKRMIVSIPNELSPVLKIRDFGPGITPERMTNVFINYGSSTKRGDNSATGGFGLGGKSAWSYTDSFTIVSVTGGKKRTYVAHTGANSQGRLDLLSTINTDEYTGVEIQVAVKPHDCKEFRDAVYRACYFWQESERPELRGLSALDTVPKHIPQLVISKDLELYSTSLPGFLEIDDYSHRCVLVIDGIPYAVSNTLADKSTNLKSILTRIKSKALLCIGNGVVEVAASREKIANSELTVKALNELSLIALIDLKAHIVSAFKTATTNEQWIKTYKQYSNLAYVDDYSKFGDYSFVQNSIHSAKFPTISIEHVRTKTSRRRRSRFGQFNSAPTPAAPSKSPITRDTGRWIPMGSIEHVFVVDTTEPVVTQNKRMREYLEQSKATEVILLSAKETMIADPNWKRPATVPGQPPLIHPMIVKTSLADSTKALNKIITDFGARNLTTLPYTPTVRVPKAKKDRTKEMFTVHRANGNGKTPWTTTIEAAESVDETFLYIPLKDWDNFAAQFNDLHEYLEVVLCGLSEDSIDMVKNCSKFKPYTEWKENFKPTPKQLLVMKAKNAKNMEYMEIFEKCHKDIKDKHFASMAAEYKTFSHFKADSAIMSSTLVGWCKDELSQFAKDDEKLTKMIKEEYPLLKVLDRYNNFYKNGEMSEELVIYINAKAKGK